jgi:hypothetical protein
VVTPVVVPLIHAALGAWGSPFNALSEILVGGGYPGLIWAAYLLLGLGIGRLDLRSPTVARRLVGFGAGVAAAAYLLSAALSGFDDGTHDPPSQFYAPSENPGEGFQWNVSDLQALLGADPHSGTPFDVFGSAGISMVVIGMCLLLCRRPGRLSFPLRATGSMVLTVYSAHIVAIFVLCLFSERNAAGVYPWQGLLTWTVFVLAAVAVSTLWVAHYGRGPIERLISSIARRSSGSRRVPAQSGV